MAGAGGVTATLVEVAASAEWLVVTGRGAPAAALVGMTAVLV